MYRNNYNSKIRTEYTYVDGIGFAPTAPVITEKHIIKEYANGVGFILLLYLLLSYTVPALLVKSFNFMSVFKVLFNGFFDNRLLITMFSAMSYIITMVIPFMLYVAMYHIPKRVIIPFSKVKGIDVILMVFMGLGISTIGMYSSSAIGAVFALFGIIPTSLDISFGTNIFQTIILITQVCLIAPILEEIAFRGIIMQSLRRFGDRFALIMSAFIFALIHLNFVQFPNAFLMGLIMGYFVLRTNSLRVGIIMHAVNNTLTVVMSLIIERMDITIGNLVANVVFGLYLVAGIMSFLIITKRYKNFFYITGSSCFCTSKTKIKWFLTALPMIFALVIIFSIMYRTLVFT